MFSNVTKGRIRKGHTSSRGYPFMFTNPTYEMSLSFTNICRLTLTTRIFINNIGRHHKMMMMSSNIIYKYSCSQCQSTYIGETQRHLISRISEHKGISPRTSMPFSNPPFSNIREHALSFDHPIKVDNFSVLARCPSHDLRLLESIFIHKFSPNLNNQASSFPLQTLSWGIPFFFGYIFSNSILYTITNKIIGVCIYMYMIS